MGLWAEIKYALNSTLGTEKFKPLDKILKEYVFNSKKLLASYKLYQNIFEGSFYTNQPSGNGPTKDLFVVNMSGTFKLTFYFGYTVGYIEIRINDEIRQKINVDHAHTDREYTTENIFVNAGDKISIKIYTNEERYSISILKIDMLGEIVDGSAISLLQEVKNDG